MADVDEVDRLNERYHLASGEFLKGDPEPVKELWSHKEDVSLANPYGPPMRGWDEAAKTIDMPRRCVEMVSSLATRS